MSNEQTTVQREIGIDAGHRVTNHGTKCRNVHGHRYTIRAYIEGKLFSEGEQGGMVLDFGFLKAVMMAEIDTPCDHGMIFWRGDDLMCGMFGPQLDDSIEGCGYSIINGVQFDNIDEWWGDVDRAIECEGYAERYARDGVKVYIVPFVPTAENLAKHWYERMAPHVGRLSSGQAWLSKVRVEETPNCWAEYSPIVF